MRLGNLRPHPWNFDPTGEKQRITWRFEFTLSRNHCMTFSAVGIVLGDSRLIIGSTSAIISLCSSFVKKFAEIPDANTMVLFYIKHKNIKHVHNVVL